MTMKKSEATEALTFCAAFDQRTIGHADAEAWALALADVPWDDTSRQAIADFYTAPSSDYDRDSRRFIQPHHVRAGRARIRNDRIARIVEPTPNPHDEVTYGEELRAIRRAIADGRITDEQGVENYRRWGGSLHLAYQRDETPELAPGPDAQQLRPRPVAQALATAFRRVPGAPA
jgi:hypothetical protein